MEVQEVDLDRIIDGKINRNQKNNKNKKKPKKIWKKILIVLASLIVIGITSLMILLYGPYNGFRDWLITTSMTTMTHQWIAHLFYDDETIRAVMSKNRVDEIKEDTDLNSINIETVKKEEYKNKYEKQIFAKDIDYEEYDIYADEEEYRIIKIKGKGYSGYLAAVYDPSKIRTLVTSRLGTSGQYLVDMAKNNDALLAINGGRFYDPGYSSNGANPRGVTYSNGKCMTTFSYRSTGGIIGFNKNDVLVLSTTCTKTEAERLKIRDCVTCGPFLIVNGQASKVLGNGGWGTAPRTVIGQRKDGVVLMLVIDGRTISRPGADMDDLIEVMKNYGAYNAANLDGGTSTAMVRNGKLINDPIDSSGAHKTRFIATGFGVFAD